MIPGHVTHAVSRCKIEVVLCLCCATDCLTTAARAKAVAGLLHEVTRAALEIAERRAAEDAGSALDNVVAMASRRRQAR